MTKKLLALTLMFPLLFGTNVVNSSAWRWRKDTDDKVKNSSIEAISYGG